MCFSCIRFVYVKTCLCRPPDTGCGESLELVRLMLLKCLGFRLL